MTIDIDKLLASMNEMLQECVYVPDTWPAAVDMGSLRALVDRIESLTQGRDMMGNKWAAEKDRAEAAEAELARLRSPAGDVGEVVKLLTVCDPPCGYSDICVCADHKAAADLLLRQAGEIEEAQRRYDGVYAQWGLAAKLCDEHRDRAETAEALLREAGEVVKSLRSAFEAHTQWCGDPPVEVLDADAFLAKLKPAPEPAREDTYPDRVSMELWPHSKPFAPGGTDGQ